MTTSGSVTKIKIGNNLYDISVQGKALSGIDVEGPGNVVSDIEYNSDTNKLIAKKPIDFATAEELSILEQNVIPKNFTTLSILPDDYNKNNAYVYVDYNNTSNKLSISNIVDKKIRTVKSVPSDWKNNEYIFEEVK